MRQFLAGSFPDRNGMLSLRDKDYNYLHNVLRVRSGDMISVRLPDRNLQDMTVCRIDTGSRLIILQVCAEADSLITGKSTALPSEIRTVPVEYVLFQFLPKPAKFDLIVRQAAECGINRIIPVVGEYSQHTAERMLESRRERLERIVREACQQSGSPVRTEIEPAVSPSEAGSLWEKMLAYTGDKGAAYILYERSEHTQSMYTNLQSKNDIKIAAVAVGCEGGISPSELATLESAGFVPVHFATNILRCETAAVYGTAILQAYISEFLEMP